MVPKPKYSKVNVISLLVLLPILASFLSILLKLNALASVFLFYGLPSLVLLYLQPKVAPKAAFFSIFTIPVLLILDYISHLTGQWIVPFTSFNFRFFDLVPVEDSFWVFFLTFSTVMFYEYFFDKETKKKLYERKYLSLAVAFIFVPTLWFFIGFVFPWVFYIDYFYLIWGTLGLIIPSVIFLFHYPRLTKKFLLTGVYFFYLSLVYELTALYRIWWFFPRFSKFIGWIQIGTLEFPLEEFVVWLMFCSVGILAWYEYFDDDRK